MKNAYRVSAHALILTYNIITVPRALHISAFIGIIIRLFTWFSCCHLSKASEVLNLLASLFVACNMQTHTVAQSNTDLHSYTDR